MGLFDNLPWADWEPKHFGKKDKYDGKETDLQASCWKLLKYLPGDPIMYHVANERNTGTMTGKNGKQFSPRGNALKAQGVTPGIPDLIISQPTGRWAGLVVELKVKGGSLTFEQRHQLWKFDRDNHFACVVWSIDAFQNVLEEYYQRVIFNARASKVE